MVAIDRCTPSVGFGSRWAMSLERNRAVRQRDTREDTRPARDHVVSPHLNTLAEDRATGDLGAVPDLASGGENAVAQLASLADLGSLEQDGALDDAARADRDVCSEHHEAADMRPVRDPHAALQ